MARDRFVLSFLTECRDSPCCMSRQRNHQWFKEIQEKSFCCEILLASFVA
jgi:hypothetical protein